MCEHGCERGEKRHEDCHEPHEWVCQNCQGTGMTYQVAYCGCCCEDVPCDACCDGVQWEYVKED